MIRYRKFILTALLVCSAFSAMAQSDPKAIQKQLDDFRRTEFSTQSKTFEEYQGHQAKVKAKAIELLKDVDPEKVEAKDAFDWARLFSAADRQKDVCNLIHKYLTTNPSIDEKFSAQMLMMTACNSLGEADMLETTLNDVRAPKVPNGMALANSASTYADTIKEKKGLDEALKMLDSVLANLPTETPADGAKRIFEQQKKNPNYKDDTSKTDEEKLKALEVTAQNQHDQMLSTIITKKAELLDDAGKSSDGLKVMDDFIKTLDEKSPARRSALYQRNKLALPNNPAPALHLEKAIGDFTSLEAWKGKVVVVDFFAHWCGPCIASFPEMEKMYGDLHSKGLEIVGVTSYYGYYKRENTEHRDMAKDVEFGHMGDFIKEHNMTWPVAYCDKADGQAYGAAFIPYAVVIDKKGVVRKIRVGYDEKSFGEFRTLIEKLMAE